MNFTRIFEIPQYQLQQYPQPDMLGHKEGGQWKKLSTQDFISQADQASAGLLDLGLKRNDKVALISNNRPEWNIIDIAMLQLGIVNIPIYPTISEQDYKYIFNHAQIKCAFVSDADLLKKIQSIRPDVPTLQNIFTFDQVPEGSHWKTIFKEPQAHHLQEIEHSRRLITEEDLATIIYTSGTTGTPKGVMLTHKNIVSNVKSCAPLLPVNNTHRTLSFLPLSHSFERTVTYICMVAGASIYYAESMETIGENIKEVKPHFFSAVPRLLEKVYEKIIAKGRALTGVKKKLFFWALELGLQYDETGNSAWYNFKLSIARKLIFSKWCEALGGEVLGIVTGSAALQTRLSRVFNAAGINVREGYGLTETSPVVAFNRFNDQDFRIGTVGPPINGVEIKIEPSSGELLVRGSLVMKGYYKEPELTAQVIDKDGWFHTGDVVELVEGRFIKITDRLKELFKTSGGKYVAPQPIENKLKESPFIEQVMIIGENEKFVGALIVPNVEQLKDFCNKINLPPGSLEKIITYPQVQQKYQQIIHEINKNFGHVEQVKQFRLMPAEWSIDSGELTPTLKVKRKVVMQQWKHLIEDIYRGGNRDEAEI